MLRIHGDRGSLLAALAAHWADQQLQIHRPPLTPLGRLQAPAQVITEGLEDAPGRLATPLRGRAR